MLGPATTLMDKHERLKANTQMPSTGLPAQCLGTRSLRNNVQESLLSTAKASNKYAKGMQVL